MKRSDRTDEAFKRRVAEEFHRAVWKAQEQNIPVEAFARKLGVTRAGVYKILSGKTIPSLRVLSKARRFFGVRISYGELGDQYVKARRTDPRQMKIELSVSDVSKDQIQIKKFSPVGENSLELLIRINFSKTA